MMDDKFTEAAIENYKKYATAFFPGANVDIIRQGMALIGKKAAQQKSVPKKFLKDAKVTCRSR